MINKTLALLKGTPPGTFLPDDANCYDPEEIDALGHVLKQLTYAPSSIRKLLQDKYGVTITRADFYSEIPTIAELERSFQTRSLLTLDTIFPDNATMLAELERMDGFAAEFDPPRRATRAGEYAWEGGPFSYSDAMSYYTMIRSRKPRTILEIGSGWSTLIARMACERNGFGRIICVEPYPSDTLAALPGIELVRRRAQELETSFFQNVLNDGDILFIDSTHTVKHDSDCLHIYLRILPALRPSLTVHVHDIRLPEPLPIVSMRDHQIFWNEQYLLYAYLLSNPRTRTIYGSNYHMLRNRERLDHFMRGRFGSGGASFWFEQARV
jgi:predicted O-methyltransferase YrrM